MAHRSLAGRIALSALIPLLVACGNLATGELPPVEPVINVTPAPTQDVAATKTAYALRIVPTPTPQGQYIVKAGDTLGTIADNFETTVDEIMATNQIADPNQIEVGQSLIIPSLLTPTATGSESAAPGP